MSGSKRQLTVEDERHSLPTVVLSLILRSAPAVTNALTISGNPNPLAYMRAVAPVWGRDDDGKNMHWVMSDELRVVVHAVSKEEDGGVVISFIDE